MAETALAYAESGVGKTSLCISLSKWMYETHGLTTRLISADLGGWSVVSREGLIQAKIVDAFNLAGRPKLLNIIRKLARGQWPTVVTKTVALLDADGVETGQTKQQKCLELQDNPAALAKVGLYFIEGCTSISDGFMKFIVDEEAETGKPIGPQGTSGRYESDGESLGGNSQGHYNIVQGEMNKLFSMFSGLNGVKLIFWSGLVGPGTLKGESVYAPMLVGEAKNAIVPSWVGDCFHLAGIPKVMDEQGNTLQEKEVRAYFETHKDTGELIEGKRYLAKSRAALSDIQALNERFPGGYVPLGTKEEEGIAEYYKWIDSRGKGNFTSLMEWKGRVDASKSK